MQDALYILLAVVTLFAMVAAFFALAYGIFWFVERHERYTPLQRGFDVSPPPAQQNTLIGDRFSRGSASRR